MRIVIFEILIGHYIELTVKWIRSIWRHNRRRRESRKRVWHCSTAVIVDERSLCQTPYCLNYFIVDERLEVVDHW